MIAFAITAFLILVNAQTVQEWVIPAKYKTMKNPTSLSKENLANAKDLYAKNCKSCHGATGLGDGSRAASLDATCGDFSTDKFQGPRGRTLDTPSHAGGAVPQVGHQD